MWTKCVILFVAFSAAGFSIAFADSPVLLVQSDDAPQRADETRSAPAVQSEQPALEVMPIVSPEVSHEQADFDAQRQRYNGEAGDAFEQGFIAGIRHADDVSKSEASRPVDHAAPGSETCKGKCEVPGADTSKNKNKWQVRLLTPVQFQKKRPYYTIKEDTQTIKVSVCKECKCGCLGKPACCTSCGKNGCLVEETRTIKVKSLVQETDRLKDYPSESYTLRAIEVK